jgi:putative hydrolase of the HAD superfamily
MAAPATHLLFDFFGTLVAYSESRVEQGFHTSYALLLEAGAQTTYAGFLDRWEATFQEFESLAQHDLQEFSMDAVCVAYLQSMLGRHPGAATVERFRDAYLAEWNKGVQYVPGVTELLANLAERFTLAVVTNTHHAELVHRHLDAMGAGPYFAAVITSVEHGKRKPSRCIFDQALARTGGTPEAAVYIGDSFSADYRGATDAGLRCFLIDPESRHDVPETDRLTQVFEVLARLGQPERANIALEPSARN